MCRPAVPWPVLQPLIAAIKLLALMMKPSRIGEGGPAVAVEEQSVEVVETVLLVLEEGLETEGLDSHLQLSSLAPHGACSAGRMVPSLSGERGQGSFSSSRKLGCLGA